MMDYSTSINDADNPAGASPWGSSPVASPRHVRNSSYGNSGEPPSPIPYNPNQTSNGGFARDEATAGGYNRLESSIGTGSATESDSHRPDTAESTHQVQSEQITSGQQAPIQQHQQHRPEPQRYHGGARQAQQQQQQQPQGPQYKLQAKITGLERTGRKDPIMRFDVHVRIFSIQPELRIRVNLADQPSKIPNNSIP
jgi:hypothetical protein